MPRYFFHVEGAKPSIDTEGIELSDLNAARIEATCATADMLRDASRDGLRSIAPLCIRVTDGGGITLFAVNVVMSETTG
jgi:hypothetical protein